MITVILEMALDDGTYWQRSTEVLDVPRIGEYIDIADPQRGGAPMPFVVATVAHRIDSHRRNPPEIAIGFGQSEPGVNQSADTWREILRGFGFIETRHPHTPQSV